ncbi:magnesium transporter [Halovenus rubra]|uniref:Magnesium transporter n=2 Tax=Halovenus rubra TaxID=869890 RepID=A0ACC7E4H9_9EURY|nr:magnesium transporter [Halovenus rubra]
MKTEPSSLGSWGWKTIVKHMFPLLVVLIVIVLLAGIRLEDARSFLSEYPILSVMIPTMVAMGGNLGSILSARLTTRFHLGTTTLDLRDRVLWANILAILALAATLFTALALGVAVLGLFVESQVGVGQLLFISLASGLSLAVIAIVFSFVTTYLSYRFGIDPDDTTIPIVTNVVDVFGMVIFLGMSRLVLG